MKERKKDRNNMKERKKERNNMKERKKDRNNMTYRNTGSTFQIEILKEWSKIFCRTKCSSL
jgi:hypothetical protein